MSSTQSGLVSNVQDRREASPSDDVRLPYTQPPPNHPNPAMYPPQHSERGVPPIPHGIHLNHDPEQARLRIPPDSSESSLSKPKPDQAHPADGRPSKVREVLLMMMMH